MRAGDKAIATDLEARVRLLESKVQELGDREALRDLRYRYHEYINEGQFADIADLFTEDGELEFGHFGRAKSREELRAFFNNFAPSSAPPGSGRPNFSFVIQYIHNHVVEVNGDRATGFSYFEGRPIVDGEAHPVSARYSDEYARTREGWRFSRIHLIPYFFVPHKEGWAQTNGSNSSGGAISRGTNYEAQWRALCPPLRIHGRRLQGCKIAWSGSAREEPGQASVRSDRI